MIRDKRYDRVSAEIAPNLLKNGKTYKWVLSALAILGPEIPEVTGLKPLRECFTKENNIEEYELENGLVQMAEWSSEYVTDLPDEAFAIILDGGEKDTEGKTKLRSLRKLPHHNSNVKSGDENDSVDLPHLRNAIARLPQVNMSLEQKKETLSHLQAHAVAANEGHNYNWDNLYAQFEQKIDKGGSKLNETQTKLLNAMETVKTNEKKVIELEEQGRKNRIQAKLDTLRVPAFKFYAEQFYDWATKSGEEVIKFSRDGVIKEVLKEQVVDEFVGLINKATDNLFIQHSKVDIFKRDDVPGDNNPKDEVARRIDIYMKEHPTTTYSQAMDVVLTADPMLKEA